MCVGGGGGDPCQGKHREFGNFAKRQGNLFAQVVNSLNQKVKGYCDICSKNFRSFLEAVKSVLCM